MRILIWSETFWPQVGGVEVLATQLLPALRGLGHEFIVVTRQDDPDLPMESHYKGIPIYRFPFWTALTPVSMELWAKVQRQVFELKRAFAPDLIHLYSIGPSVMFHLSTQNAHSAPFLVTLHNSLRYAPGHNTLLKQVLCSAAWVSCVSEAVLTETCQLLPDVSVRSSIIYNGIQRCPLLPAPLPVDAPRLLCLGRLVDEKGFDLALQALALIIDRFPRLHMVIAGDGSARPKLEKQARELGIDRFVEFLGWVVPKDVPSLMNSSTLFVMPSRWSEPFGLVALEAAQMARPTIATRVGGIPEIVVDRETGLLVEKEDSVALAQAIVFLLDHPEAAAKMGNAARRRFLELFSMDRCAAAYDAHYRKLIRQGARVSVSSL